MTGPGENSLTRKEQLFNRLRREILAARLKVTLDQQLGRETSSVVKSLAGMKLPPLVRADKALTEATGQRKFQLTRKEQLFRRLRREILAARLKVTLDEQLGRETSSVVKSLAGMKLPPIKVRSCGRIRERT